MNFGDILLPPHDPIGTKDSFRFGTITSTYPFRVRVDGDSNSIDAAPTRLVEVGTGDRVFCQFHGQQLLIVGRVGGFGAMRSLTGQHLNNVYESGLYHQQYSVEATPERKYPSQRAGLLEVFSASNYTDTGTSYVYQRYTTYNGDEQWQRTSYAGEWNWWTLVARKRSWRGVGGSDSTVRVYTGSSAPRISEVNGTIHFTGAMETTGTSDSGKIAQLSSWAIPSGYDLIFTCSSTGLSTWTLRVDTSTGAVGFERHSASAMRAGLWLPFSVSWPANDLGL